MAATGVTAEQPSHPRTNAGGASHYRGAERGMAATSVTAETAIPSRARTQAGQHGARAVEPGNHPTIAGRGM